MLPSLFKTTHPVRRINLALFGIFVVLTLLLAFGLIDVKAHQDEWFLAWMMGISAIAMLLPHLLIIAVPRLKKSASESFLAMEESLLALAMILSWIGAFGPYRWGFGYDSFVHFGASAIAAVMITAFVYVLAPKLRKNYIALIVIVILMALLAGAANELFEKYGDIIWGTMMYGETGQPF
ncbi:hypothetical protein KKD71_02990, partial [Patescibacteria group bacterium]|nr:hypothetical protein [Patescibacteria group bacterium]